MRRSKEIEVKLAIDSSDAAGRRLRALGARQVLERHFEDNVLFERPADPLKPAGLTLRLRRAGGKAWLTYKARVAAEGPYKVRIEHETAVDDADEMVNILKGLGFTPSYRYQKYRTLFDLEGLAVCVDETPLGCFIEIEGPPEGIDRAGAGLGFSRDQYIRESYRELHLRAASDGTIGPGDLLIGPDAETAR